MACARRLDRERDPPKHIKKRKKSVLAQQVVGVLRANARVVSTWTRILVFSVFKRAHDSCCWADKHARAPLYTRALTGLHLLFASHSYSGPSVFLWQQLHKTTTHHPKIGRDRSCGQMDKWGADSKTRHKKPGTLVLWCVAPVLLLL